MAGKQDWNTPEEILTPTRALFGGQIELDPFHNEHSIVGALNTFDGDDSGDGQGCGFAGSWVGQTFVNGPWGRTKDVVTKCVEEWLWGSAEIVAVVPTSLNSSYWHLVEQAPAVCRPYRRVSFLRDGQPVKSNRQDCVVVYWGPDIYRFRALFGSLGRVRFG